MTRSTALAVVEEPNMTEDQIERELPLLTEMLESMRPAWSKAEKRFIKKYIAPLGAKTDQFGNYWVRIGQSAVLWSSHTDTVHRNGGQQTVVLDRNTNVVSVRGSNCLGADCTTGVWLMRQMILAGVPGNYVFHRAEEIGASGSAGISNLAKRSTLFEELGLKYAIAFDRRGFTSVVTHQGGARCASQEFVDSIAPMLPPGYVADDGGTFTDTANYMDQLPECTNLSVGYLAQHTSKETQDLEHAAILAIHLMRFDESKLVAKRDPKVVEYASYGGRFKGDMSPWNEQGLKTWEEDLHGFNDDRTVVDIQQARAEARRRLDDDRAYEQGKWQRARVRDYEPRTIYDVIKDYPAEVADYLEQMGYDAEQLLDDMGFDRLH